MSKIARLVTLEYEIWDEAKRSGINISETCEQALACAINTDKSIFYDIIKLSENNEFLNKMIFGVCRERFGPHVWAKLVQSELGYNANPHEIKIFVDDITGGENVRMERTHRPGFIRL